MGGSTVEANMSSPPAWVYDDEAGQCVDPQPVATQVQHVMRNEHRLEPRHLEHERCLEFCPDAEPDAVDGLLRGGPVAVHLTVAGAACIAEAPFCALGIASMLLKRVIDTGTHMHEKPPPLGGDTRSFMTVLFGNPLD